MTLARKLNNYLSKMSKTNFIVTGANGFLGSHIVKELLKQKYSVVAVIRRHNDWSQAQKDNNLQMVTADVCDNEGLAKIFDEFANRHTVVIHAAGKISISTKLTKELEKVNIGGTKNIIKLSKKHQIKRLVYVSSVHALTEKPNNQVIFETNDFDPQKVFGGYAKTKAAASRLINQARDNLDAMIVHPSGLIGPGNPKNSYFKQMMIDYAKGQFRMTLSGGYDFTDVRDVASAIVTASLKPSAKNQNYLLANQFLSLSELLTTIDQKLGRQKKLIILPKWLGLLTGFLAEIFYKLTRRTPVITYYSVKTMYSNGNFSHAKASRELDYQPRPIKQSIADTIDNLKQQGMIE